MAKEAIVASLPLSTEQRAGVAVYIGEAIKANREAQGLIVSSVKVFKEPSHMVVLGDLSNAHGAELGPAFSAESKAHRLTEEADVFNSLSALSSPDESGISVSTPPILDMTIPVQPLSIGSNS